MNTGNTASVTLRIIGTGSLFLFLCVGWSRPAYLSRFEPDQQLPALAGNVLQLSDTEFESLDRGEAIVKLLKTAEPKELAAAGIVRLKATKEFFLEKFRDIANFKKNSAVLQIGKFSKLPVVADLRELTLEPDDIEDLKKCEPGDCEVKLASKSITRFKTEIDWAAQDYREKANALFRRILLDYVMSYTAKGNAALAEYDDKRTPVRLEDESRALLKQSPYLFDYAPEFYKYLDEYPRASLSGAESFVYWSKEKFGLKAVVSLTHVTIFKRSKTEILIASKQIYANHYFDASLGLTHLADTGSQGTEAYLVYLNRSRADGLQGGFSKVKRSLLTGEVREGMARNLRQTKQRLDAEYAARPAPRRK